MLTVPSPAAFEAPSDDAVSVWVGSVGYETHRDSHEFARFVHSAGVERLIDVRELPISRKRGFAKTALSDSMKAEDVEYLHLRDLGNPKPIRDIYKSGDPEKGHLLYRSFLLDEKRDALLRLSDLLGEKRSALMCVEDDACQCHRQVIIDALQDELGLTLTVADIGSES